MDRPSVDDEAQDVRGKRLADAVEALIGTVFLVSGGGPALGLGSSRPLALPSASGIRDDRLVPQGGFSHSWDPDAIFSAVEAASLLSERLGVLPAGGHAVVQSVLSGAASGMQSRCLPLEQELKVS